MEPFQLKDRDTRQPSGPYWIKFRAPGEKGYRRVVGGATPSEARNALARIEVQIEDGIWRDPRIERKRTPILEAPKTLGQLFERYIETHDNTDDPDGRSPKTVKSYQDAREIIFRVLPPNTPLVSLARHVLRDARAALESLSPEKGAPRRYKTSTLNLTLSKFRSVLLWADEQEYPTIRPGLATCISSFQQGTRKIVGNCKQVDDGDFLTDEEIQLVLSEADRTECQDFACRLAFGFGTGARISEIAGVKWCDIDAKARTVHIRRQAIRNRTKNRKARLVPLSKELVKRLQAWQLASPYSDSQHPVFPKPNGRHQSESMKIAPIFARVAKRCGVVKPRYNNHMMRHSYISNWMRAGKSSFLLIRIVGHSNTREIEEVYGHLVTADLVAALDAGERPTVRPKNMVIGEQE